MKKHTADEEFMFLNTIAMFIDLGMSKAKYKFLRSFIAYR